MFAVTQSRRVLFTKNIQRLLQLRNADQCVNHDVAKKFPTAACIFVRTALADYGDYGGLFSDTYSVISC